MRPRRLRVLSLGAVAAAAALALVAARAVAPPTEVPTVEVRPGTVVRRVVADGELAAVHSTPLSVPVRRGGRSYRVSWLIPEGTPVAAGDVVARFDPVDFERELEEGRSERSIAEARLGAAEAQRRATMLDAERSRHLSERELEVARRFQATDTTLYSTVEILSSAIDTELAQRRTQHAAASMQIHDEHTRADLALLEIDQKKAALKMEQAQEGLATLRLTAPHAGLVAFERDWRGNPVEIGESAWPGRVIASIPDLTELQAEVYVLEADAGDLVAGQEASVIVEAHPETAHSATVTSIDPVAKPRQRSPVQYFRCVLALERTDPAIMRPGQTVQAEIILGRHEHAISVPRQAVFDRAGRTIVYRARGRGFDEVPVVLGEAGVGRVLVREGLEAGDIIALADPTRAPGTGSTADVAPDDHSGVRGAAAQ